MGNSLDLLFVNKYIYHILVQQDPYNKGIYVYVVILFRQNLRIFVTDGTNIKRETCFNPWYFDSSQKFWWTKGYSDRIIKIEIELP